MSVDPGNRFSAVAGLYAQYRPGYPASMADWIVSRARIRPPARIADVGCGTGISSRLFAGRGFRVTGVDPNTEMLEQARAAGGAEYRQGTADATGLEDAGTALVTVAQAAHWFALEPAFREFRRILEPSGAVVLFWNVRTSSPFMDGYDAALKRFSTEYAIAHGDRIPDSARLRTLPGVTSVETARFPNPTLLDWAGLQGRAFSASYVQHGVADKAGFERDLKALFEAHAASGKAEFLHKTEVFLCRLS